MHYDNGELDSFDIGVEHFLDKNHKDIYYKLTHQYISEVQVFRFLDQRHEEKAKMFKQEIMHFLNN